MIGGEVGCLAGEYLQCVLVHVLRGKKQLGVCKVLKKKRDKEEQEEDPEEEV